MIEGIQKIREIFKTPSMQELEAVELQPGLIASKIMI